MLLALTWLLLPDALRAQAPTLLLARVAAPGRGAELEQRLGTEIRLALEGYEVKEIALGEGELGALPLGTQLKSLKPFIERWGVDAVVWLEPEAPVGLAALNVLRARGALALITRVTVTDQLGGEANLAMALREALASSLLDEVERQRDATPPRGAAATNAAPATTGPELLLVRAAVDPAGSAGDALLDALRQAMPALRWSAVEPAAFDIGAATLQQSLGWHQRLLSQRRALAALWAQREAGRLTLYLVDASASRTLLWVVRGAREEELARAARAILETAYLEGAPVAREAAAAPPPRVEAAAPTLHATRWTLAAEGLARSAWNGGAGPTTGLGARLTLGYRAIGLLVGRADAQLTSGPWAETAAARVHGWSAAVGLGLGYDLPLGPLRLEPGVGLQLSYAALQAELGGGPKGRYDLWNLRALSGAQLAWPMAPWMALLLRGELAANLHQYAVERASDGRTLVATPWGEWQLGCGVRVGLDSAL